MKNCASVPEWEKNEFYSLWKAWTCISLCLPIGEDQPRLLSSCFPQGVKLIFSSDPSSVSGVYANGFSKRKKIRFLNHIDDISVEWKTARVYRSEKKITVLTIDQEFSWIHCPDCYFFKWSFQCFRRVRERFFQAEKDQVFKPHWWYLCWMKNCASVPEWEKNNSLDNRPRIFMNPLPRLLFFQVILPVFQACTRTVFPSGKRSGF